MPKETKPHYSRSGVRGRTSAGWPFIGIGIEDKGTTILVLYGRTNEEQCAAEREARLVVDALNTYDPDHEKQLVDALQPFADAADNLDDKTRDNSEIWESPAAMSITAGDLRRARALLAELAKK